MPGILPMKVIKVGNSAQARIAQACDRCRSKKIRCDGLRPTCSQCSNVGFECKTSDKLSRRAFPRGYTESLEERVRALELEIRELKDLLDAKDDKIDMLSKLYSPSHASFASRRQSDRKSPSALDAARQSLQEESPQQFRVNQEQSLHIDGHHDAHFVGTANSCALLDAVKTKADSTGRPCPEFNAGTLAPTTSPKSATTPKASGKPSVNGPSRLLSDQMVNIFFQEWAPLLPVVHRPSFLKLYEQYVSDSTQLNDIAELIQLHLVFGISATSNKTRISYDTNQVSTHWLNVLDASARKNSMVNLQCLLLATMFCVQTGDWARVLQYKERSAGMALFLGLHQSQKRFSLSVLSSETRKKVFWSLYTLDCFISALLGTPKSFHDHDVHCEQPMDVDDEYISEQGVQPLLPGEFTKLSSALSVFSGAQILSKVLTQLYPSHATYDVSMTAISGLDEELNAWSESLPPHLKMQFTDEKPSTHVISSRCPLLSLTYHYIRTLIHRQAACFAPPELSSASTVALAASSKHIIQLLALLDERNLSFSFPLNKDELLVTAGAGVLLQSLSLSRESKLLKDSQKTICTALDMLKRSKASSYNEFRQISCALVFLTGDRRSQASRSGSDDHLQAKRDLQRLTSQFPASQSSDQLYISSSESRRATLPVLSAQPNANKSPSLANNNNASSNAKRFRPIAPSTASPRSSNEFPRRDPVSPKTSMPPGRPRVQQKPGPGSLASASASSSTVNLDFFRFPNEVPSNHDVSHLPECRQTNPSEWQQILEALGDQQLSLDNGVHDWHTLSSYLPPPNEAHIRNPSPKPAQAASIYSTTSSADDWTVATNVCNTASGAPQIDGPVKPQSLFSFSEESLTSGEEFSSLDWGTNSSDSDDAFKIMMASLSPEEVDVFGLGDEAARLSNEALNNA